jgi:Raf kinase inhibitor-like YbhB/YbcL family protein
MWNAKASGIAGRGAVPFIALCLLAGHAKAEATVTLRLTSTAFANGEEIPSVFTCEGRDISPPLAWDDAPSATKTFALIVDDPDAPDPKAPTRTWVHWVVFNLPASARALPEGVRHDALPAGAVEGTNDWKKTGYGGPCPPVGRHRYFFKLYALDAALALKSATKADLERAMEGHVLAKTELLTTYEKRRR